MSDEAKNKAREAAKLRKQKSRAAAKAAGKGGVNVPLTDAQLLRLDELRVVRNPANPLSRGELLEWLFERNWQSYQKQLAEMAGKCCGKCGDALPVTTPCTLKGDSDCWQTIEGKALRLIPGHNDLND